MRSRNRIIIHFPFAKWVRCEMTSCRIITQNQADYIRSDKFMNYDFLWNSNINYYAKNKAISVPFNNHIPDAHCFTYLLCQGR